MNKIVTAIRHAKSSWADPLLPDRKRPLNERGKRAAPAIGRYLAKLGHVPDLILSSPAKRAFRTGILVAREVNYPEESIIQDPRLYFEGTSAIIEAIREQKDKYNSIFIFSHEPTISAFCSELCGLKTLKYPTAAACAMSFDIDSWKNFGLKNPGKKLFYVIPKAIDPSL